MSTASPGRVVLLWGLGKSLLRLLAVRDGLRLGESDAGMLARGSRVVETDRD